MPRLGSSLILGSGLEYHVSVRRGGFTSGIKLPQLPGSPLPSPSRKI
jgi:hypothetical protein